MEEPKLINLKEVSRLLSINTEVLRRWLRSGKLRGVKVGSDWRVNVVDLEPFLHASDNTVQSKDNNQQKMCFRFPKWLEFSGLPFFINKKIGPAGWPVLKKLIELDFELGKPANRLIELNHDEISERVGYEVPLVKDIVTGLSKLGYINIESHKRKSFFSIVTPIKTPRLILDVPYEKGGVKGAPSQALTNSCLRRFLESAPQE